MTLDEILQKLAQLPDDKRREVEQSALEATRHMIWVPNPGPQTDAYMTLADETFYGGQAGGGKTDLACGLALTAHKRSLILRRYNKDAVKIASRMVEIVGSDDGLIKSPTTMFKLGDRTCEFAGCEMESDKQRFKGDPHDLIVFDEGSDFLESQYRFIIAWNRSADPNQRCRVVVTSNPPTTSEGLWVIQHWAPWLDPTHPNPAQPGELRWFTTLEVDGKDRDVEVDGRGPHGHDDKGRPIYARSRTFIPAALADNPDLAATNYASVLDSLPGELRQAYRDGKFNAALKDAEFQLIPTAWIIAAQERWKPDGWKNTAMTAMACDPAGGGRDYEVIGWRYGGWYGPIVDTQGKETSDGATAVARLIHHRKHGAPVVVDMGGGYGGAVSLRLRDNEIPFVAFNGAEKSRAKTKDGKLTFRNKRAEAWWKFREELDPDQEGGSAICLPPDPELRADLAAPTWELTSGGILIEAKESLRKRLGRSTGKGDVVVMCLSQGKLAAERAQNRRSYVDTGTGRRGAPQVVMGHRASHSLVRR